MVSSFSSSVAAPGTPQRITSGATPALPTLSGFFSGTIAPKGSHIVVQNSPTSAGNLYIGSSSALSVSGKTGWSAILAPGASDTVSIGNGSDLGCIWVDSDAAASYGVSFE